MAAKRLWTEIYRPRTFDGYVFQNPQHESQLRSFVESGDIPHLLLTGTQGSGKTTVAEILINMLGVEETDVMKINASNKTGVDYIRDTIIDFAESYPVGNFKVIRLEEFDYMSQAAQGMLRDVMETNADTCRFIACCNFEHKIIAPLKSRFQHLRFKAPSRDDVIVRMAEILIAENVDFDPDNLDKYISQAYPDLRKIINNLQLNTVNGTLGAPSQDADGEDYQFKLLDLLQAGKLREFSDMVIQQCSTEQLNEVYEFLEKNLHQHPKLKNDRATYEQCLCILLDGVYKHGLVGLPQLNFKVMCIKLLQVLE